MNLRKKAIGKNLHIHEKLAAGLRGTEFDPAVTPTPQCKKILFHITGLGAVWEWPARSEGKWRLDPAPEDWITVVTTKYDRLEGRVFFDYNWDVMEAGTKKTVIKHGNIDLKDIPKWEPVIDVPDKNED